jgi:aminoglycoside phosphotransferase (APT) family kinase protein
VGNRAYCLLSFIEGKAALDALGRCPPDAQCAVGVQAGADLRRMHRVLPARPVRPWDERILDKHRAGLAAYWTCGVRVEHDEEIAAFIEANADAVRGRPSHFQHGDFHVANLVMRDQRYAGAIDFDRWDWGDPYQEFLKVGFFSSAVSVPFCNGQIHGYFDGATPDGFWRLCAVYTAMSVLGSVVWARRRTPDEVDEMVEFSNRVTGDYDQFRSVVPRWFQPVRG